MGAGAAAYQSTPGSLKPSINEGGESGVKFTPLAWLNGRVALAGVDGFSATVEWAREVVVPLAAPLAPWVLAVVARGEGGASATGSYVQVVGLKVALQ